MSARERGAALVAVLLLVGVMGAIAAALLEQSRMASRTLANLIDREAARSLLRAAEAIAVRRVAALAEAPDRATRTGGWQGRPIVLPLPGGVARVVPRDGGNCFNLNSLVTMAGPESLVARPLAVAQFASLMEALAVPAPRARAIAAATADWIDSDDQPLPLGAEDAAYRGRGYLAGATLMADVSELRAVAGVVSGDARDDQYWNRLRPLLCALPDTNLSPINPNTLLPGQEPLLAMLLPETLGPPLARLARARRILAARPAAGWGSVSEFANSELLREAALPGDVLQQLTVRTGWVALAFEVRRGETVARGWSLVDARNRGARIVARRLDGDDA